MIGSRKSVALAAAIGLALAASGCDDSAANQKANEEAKARSEAAEKGQKLKDGVAHNVTCLSALRWQKAALAGAGVGDLKIYEDHFRDGLDKALGSEILPKGDDGAPTLSRANTFDYVEWSYGNDVKTKFTAGTDANKDGTVSAAERSGRGFNTVVACVQEVAEAGKGPLAGKDKVGRAYRMEAIRKQLKDRGV